MSELVDKRKNDELKAKNVAKEHPAYFKVLMFLWAFNSVRNLEGAFDLQAEINAYLLQYSSYSLPVLMLQLYVVFIVLAIPGIIACVWGLWNWKKWGYFGLGAILITATGFDLLTGFLFKSDMHFIAAAVRIVPGLILYFAMRGKTQHLT